jgi:hypothetical protein
MSEETTTTETETKTESTAVSASDVRNHELFQKQCAKEKEARERYDALVASQAEAKEKAERDNLEAEGNWKALQERLEADHAKNVAEIEAKLIEERLTNKLVLAGVTHEFAIMAAKQQYTPGDKSMDDFVKDFAESDQVKALVTPSKTGLPPAPGGDAAARSTQTNWAQAKADLASNDLEKVTAAELAVREFFTANDKMPPGFDQ